MYASVAGPGAVVGGGSSGSGTMGIVSGTTGVISVKDSGIKEGRAGGGGGSAPAKDTIHSVITSSGSAYQNFQGRIM